MVDRENIQTTATYSVEVSVPWCFDDGHPVHDQGWEKKIEPIEANSDREAQLLSLELRKPEFCYHGRYSITHRIIKTVREVTEDGFERETSYDIPVPRKKKCPCGREYWPVKGEEACHAIVPADSAS